MDIDLTCVCGHISKRGWPNRWGSGVRWRCIASVYFDGLSFTFAISEVVAHRSQGSSGVVEYLFNQVVHEGLAGVDASAASKRDSVTQSDSQTAPDNSQNANQLNVNQQNAAPSNTDDGTQYAAGQGTPGNNQAQNKQFNDVVRIARLTPDQAQMLHREVSGQNYGFHEILQIAQFIKAGN